MVVAQHIFEFDHFFIKQFTHHDEAADFIDMLAHKGEFDES